MRRSGAMKAPQLDSQSLDRLRELQITDVAPLLGIKMHRGKAMCFNGHDRLSPSFTIGKNKTSWKCYGCGEFGDAISLVQKCLSVDFKGACTWLCAQFGISRHDATAAPRPLRQPTPEGPRNRQSTQQASTAADPAVYSWLVQHCGPVTQPVGINYLVNHGIPTAVASAFGVVELKDPAHAYRKLEKHWGYERLRKCGLVSHKRALLWSGYSILFPFYNEGTVEYIQLRCLESDKKFMGPKEVPKPIFNRTRLKQLHIGQTLHICEGVPDTLALEACGLHAIGILGATSFRLEWVALKPFEDSQASQTESLL